MAILLLLGPVPRGGKAAFSLMILGHISGQWGALPSGLVMDAHWAQVLRYIGASTSVFLTIFLLLVFSEKRAFFWAWIVSSAVICLGLVLVPIYRDLVVPLRVYSALHYSGLGLLILAEARDDLLQRRRVARFAVSFAIVLYAVILAVTSRRMVPDQDLAGPFISNLLLFIASLSFATWVFQVNASHWIGAMNEAPKSPATSAQTRATQNALCRKIERAMQGDIWRREGLTVAQLAHAVDAPEHQVRKAINQTLGFRNFSIFINKARIDAAKGLLASTDARTMSVQEIAYEVGFSSLGPFNRAFREATGLSPTEFRSAKAAS